MATKGQGSMTVSEAGRKGGTTTRDTYGSAHYSALGKKGGAARKSQGIDYHEMGRMGGAAVKERYGIGYFSEIGNRNKDAAHWTARCTPEQRHAWGLRMAEARARKHAA